MLPDINKNRHHAVESAVKTNVSYYGDVITEKNPLEDRHLSRTLRRLDQDKKTAQYKSFWNQRQFFIDRAFDDNEELRFVKLKNKILVDLSDINTPLANKYARSASSYNSRNSSRRESRDVKAKTSLSEKIFPVSDDFHSSKKDLNYLLLQQKQKRISLARNTRTASSKRKSGYAPLPMLETISQDPSVISVSGRHVESDHVKSKVSIGHLTSQSELGSGPYILSDQPCSTSRSGTRPRVGGFDDAISCVQLANENTTVQSDKVHSEVRELSSTAILMNPIGTNVMEREVTLSNKSLAGPNHFKRRKEKVPSSVRNGKKLSPDELLLKLTMSLPMHMLLKTDETLNDLSTALGFSERNKRFKEQEQCKSRKCAIADDRFKKLQDSLVRMTPKDHAV